MSVMNELEKFLISEIAVDLGDDAKSLSPDENLISKGIVDSMGIMKLTAFIEKNFGVTVGDEDIIPENFQNLNCLSEFVERKMQNK